MLGGDDPTSTRFYDHIAAGIPQIILSDFFWDQASPFRCQIDYYNMSFWMDEVRFKSAAHS
eukprot:scaffold652021_cov48-Prasinocladus_malaysianus.AAC.1